MKQRQYNLDKTAYDLEKRKQKIYLEEFYIYVLPLISLRKF